MLIQAAGAGNQVRVSLGRRLGPRAFVMAPHPAYRFAQSFSLPDLSCNKPGSESSFEITSSALGPNYPCCSGDGSDQHLSF